MKNLVKDASMGPLREALRHGIEITQLKKEDMRPVNLQVIICKLDGVLQEGTSRQMLINSLVFV